jgi:murein DD-endopeptidase MepM/ murein hydrolase activator NlpD
VDRKIRISFFPTDASKVRFLAFSTRLAVAFMALAIPLSLGGYWLMVTGTLRDDHQVALQHKRSQRQTRLLEEHLSHLRMEAETLEEGLAPLAMNRVNLLLATGLEEEKRAQKNEKSWPSYFRLTQHREKGDFQKALAQAKGVSLFLDSTLFILGRRGEEVEHLPTYPPAGPEALLTRRFGFQPDPFTGRKALHPGLDYFRPEGSPVYAAGGGDILMAGWDPLWGNCARIRHSPQVETFYAHLEKLEIKKGNSVSRGQVLGTVGATGMTTGDHLHFELLIGGERVDPEDYLLMPEPAYTAVKSITLP